MVSKVIQSHEDSADESSSVLTTNSEKTSLQCNRTATQVYGLTTAVNTIDNENSTPESKSNGTMVDDTTFRGLMKKNRAFRLYLMSYVVTLTGEWLTYIASIALIEELVANSERPSQKAISIFMVARLLPNVVLCPIGGILADGRDLRVSMIFLDLLGGVSSLLFLASMYFQSIEVIYFATFLQQCIAGLYEPCRSSIVPLLVPQEDYLKKAITVAGISWSAIAAFGSSLGGLLVMRFGFRTCFLVDACSYLASAFLMYLVKGKWYAVHEKEEEFDTMWGLFCDMALDGIAYLRGSFFGGLVLMKATTGMMYGAVDVLNVAFSEPDGVQDEKSPARLGLLLAFTGIGCTVGPLIADLFTNMKNPVSLQKSCIAGMAIATAGFFATALFSPFWSICIFTLIRSAGGSTNWIDSSILLQKFTSGGMVGRVLAVDYSLALLARALAAFLAGSMLDTWSMTAHQVGFLISFLSALLAICWLVYHASGHGAGAEPRNASLSGKEDQCYWVKSDVEKVPLTG